MIRRGRQLIEADRLAGGMLEHLLPHLLTTAKTLAGCRLVAEHRRLASGGGIGGADQDELRLFLTARDAPTVNLVLSLSAQPRAFVLMVRGTRATLAIDLRNMLLLLSQPAARGGALACGANLLRGAAGTLVQTAVNAAGLLAGRRVAYGSLVPLFQAHYAALEVGREAPAPSSKAAETVETIRRIWPL